MKSLKPVLFMVFLFSLVLSGPAARADVVIVTQVGFTFDPAAVTIAAGDTIRWVYTSGIHTTTSGTGPADPQTGLLWDEPLTAADPAYEHEFTTADVYPYYCKFHFNLGMTGTITVINDSDGDGVPDETDNCPNDFNPGQGDGDVDGYGTACDCDDGNPSITEGDPWYADTDGDGFGDIGSAQNACSQPPNYVANDLDCDDNDADTYPGADEFCNGLDNDCDGTPDDNALDPATWYIDTDGDGYGTAITTLVQCNQPNGYADNDLDCDDGDPAINPETVWYQDGDNDGFGDLSSSTVQCTQPGGFVLDNSDCDDTDFAIRPGADEFCNGLDDDCNGTPDDNPVDGQTWYQDVDNDTYGDAGSSTIQCSQPVGYVADGSDCDDTNPDINPAASEVCNGLDDDCDTQSDEDFSDPDGDGWGTACDNCPDVFNPGQEDTNNNSIGDACECFCGVKGDMNNDGSTNPVDVVFQVNHVYKQLDGRIYPAGWSCPFDLGDMNCDNAVNPVDVVFMVNLVYKSLDAVCEGCSI